MGHPGVAIDSAVSHTGIFVGHLIKIRWRAAFFLTGMMLSLLAHADTGAIGLTPDAKRYQQYFREAAIEFNVPVELLQAIAYVETRWQPVVPQRRGEEAQGEGIVAEPHHGRPVGYGIMGLHDDPHFGRSLTEAAKLIGQKPAALQSDTRANIRGAAALLSRYGAPHTRQSRLEAWEAALARYSGIPQRDIAQLYTYEIFSAIDQGRQSEQFAISQRDVDLEKIYDRETLKRLSAH